MSKDLRTPLDDEIDLVARVLTEAPPPDGLRSAIHTAVTEGSRAKHAPGWYSVGAATVVAGTILLFWISREGQPSERSGEITVPTVATAPTPTVTQPPSSTVTASPTTQLAVTASRGRSIEPRPGVSSPLPATPSEISDPIEVEQLEVPPLELDEISLPTFAVEALTLEPVSLQ